MEAKTKYYAYFLRVCRNTFWIGIGEIIHKASLFISIILISRNLSVEEFGRMMYAISFVGFFAAFSDMGFSTVGVRDMARLDEKATYWRNLFTLRILSSPIAILGFLSIIVMNPKMTSVYSVAGLSLVYTLSMFMLEFIVIRFRVDEKMHFESLIKSICGILRLGAVYLIVQQSTGLTEAFIALSAPTVVGFLLGIALLKKVNDRIEWRFDTALSRKIMKDSLPVVMAFLLMYAYSKADQFIIYNMLGESSSGLYQVCVNLIYLVLILVSIVLNAFYPLLSQKINMRNLQKNKALTAAAVLFLLGLFVLTLFYFYGSWLLVFIYGTKYATSSLILKFYMFVLPSLMCLSFFNFYFVTVGHPKKCISVNVLACALTPLIAIGVKVGEINGAALANSLVGLIVCSYGFLTIKNLPNIETEIDDPHFALGRPL